MLVSLCMFKYEVFEKAKKQMTIPIVFIYHEYAGHVVANRLATNLDQIYTFLKLSQSYLGPAFIFAWPYQIFHLILLLIFLNLFN